MQPSDCRRKPVAHSPTKVTATEQAETTSAKTGGHVTSRRKHVQTPDDGRGAARRRRHRHRTRWSPSLGVGQGTAHHCCHCRGAFLPDQDVPVPRLLHPLRVHGEHPADPGPDLCELAGAANPSRSSAETLLFSRTPRDGCKTPDAATTPLVGSARSPPSLAWRRTTPSSTWSSASLACPVTRSSAATPTAS